MLNQNKDNPYFLSMKTHFNDKTMPNKTMNDWVTCFLKIRTEARQALAVVDYFEHPNQDQRINKRDNRNKERDHSKDSFNDQIGQSNKQKSERKKEAYQKLKDRYNEKRSCNGCGWWSHQVATCKSLHPDRNQQPMAFHLSDKGKQWMSNVKFGPFVNPNFLLNGEPYRKPQEGSETDKTDR